MTGSPSPAGCSKLRPYYSINKGLNMREKELCVTLIKCITEAILEHTQNQSETLKIITIGVQAALNSNKEEEK